jgi:hypothetical protein
MILKRSVFGDITPSSMLKVDRRFGGTHLHRQGWIASQARNQHETCLLFSGLHSVISRTIEFFITTSVRTSNPTFIILFRLLKS